MPAPTAPLKQQQQPPPPPLVDPLPQADDGNDEGFALEGMDVLPSDGAPAAIRHPVATSLLSSPDMDIDEESKPQFGPAAADGAGSVAAAAAAAAHVQTRKVPIPPHRMTPLKAAWPKVYTPLVEHLRLQVRMNPKHKRVELRTSRHTADDGAIQKGEDVSFIPPPPPSLPAPAVPGTSRADGRR